MTEPAHRRVWGLPGGMAGLVAIVLVAGAIGVFALLSGGSDGKPDAGRAEIEAYEAKLLPLVQEWGRIEIQGMRPAISDLVSGEGVPPETVGGEARAWRAGFVDLRKKIAEVPAPPALARAKLLFDRAMVRYIAAAEEFERAADGPVEQRQAGIDKGIAAATDGAALYNDASLQLQAARKRVGLPPSKDFPNHKAGEEKVS